MSLDFWSTVEPADLFKAVAEESNRQQVVKVLRSLTPDPVWTNVIVGQIEAGGIDVRCFIHWLAVKLQPQSYLEVGVRRGFSMAMVAAQCPEAAIYGFDLWIPEYTGVSNPGPQFVQSEMRRLGYNKKVRLVNGDSHKTLPAFFGNGGGRLWDRLRIGGAAKAKSTTFDLIVIDGDHSLLGGYQDLLDTMPHCSVGGVVVFDDIAPDLSQFSPTELDEIKKELGEDPHGWGSLLGVWHAIQKRFPNFRYFEYTSTPPGTGLAVRLS
jgi:predicted O-methyltransferase YrrM